MYITNELHLRIPQILCVVYAKLTCKCCVIWPNTIGQQQTASDHNGLHWTLVDHIIVQCIGHYIGWH